LASTYFRQGAFGQAIFHLRTAQRLSPRDPDISYNLAFVRRQATDKIEASPHDAARSFAERFPLSSRELAYLLLVLVIASCGFSVALLYTASSALRVSRRVFVMITLCCLAAGGFRQRGLDDFGVVTSPQAEVLSGQGEGNILLFSLHQGAEFTVKDQSGEWLRISLADGKQGWINRSQVASSI
jgi:hypothetical protein